MLKKLMSILSIITIVPLTGIVFLTSNVSAASTSQPADTATVIKPSEDLLLRPTPRLNGGINGNDFHKQGKIDHKTSVCVASMLGIAVSTVSSVPWYKAAAIFGFNVMSACM